MALFLQWKRRALDSREGESDLFRTSIRRVQGHSFTGSRFHQASETETAGSRVEAIARGAFPHADSRLTCSSRERVVVRVWLHSDAIPSSLAEDHVRPQLNLGQRSNSSFRLGKRGCCCAPQQMSILIGPEDVE